jgi:hypothetical protein
MGKTVFATPWNHETSTAQLWPFEDFILFSQVKTYQGDG